MSIRRNITTPKDPYALSYNSHKSLICEDCGAVFTAGRWRLNESTGKKVTPSLSKPPPPTPVVCPACHRIRDDVPAGVVHLSGSFLEEHSEEIMRLVNHENEKAMTANPLHRVMHIAPLSDGTVEIHTTDDKLAQRIGKAIHRAYDGEIKYQSAHDNRLARVVWYRAN